jgi:hypothetical protein
MHIEIDFQVFKALTALRESESVSYNDVLRRLLTLTPHESEPSTGEERKPSGYMAAGRHLPDGTQLQATYKGKEYRAEVKRGRIVSAGGKLFNSLSAAAKDITETNVNGLRFWKAQLPSDLRWVLVAGLPTEHP